MRMTRKKVCFIEAKALLRVLRSAVARKIFDNEQIDAVVFYVVESFFVKEIPYKTEFGEVSQQVFNFLVDRRGRFF